MDLARPAPKAVVGILLVGRGPMMRRSQRGDAGCRTSCNLPPDTAWRVRLQRPDEVGASTAQLKEPHNSTRYKTKLSSSGLHHSSVQICNYATNRTRKKRTQLGTESAKDKSHASKTIMLSWLNVSEKTLWLTGDELKIVSAFCEGLVNGCAAR